MFCSPFVFAHGGVAFEEDLCVINIGFLKAHFTGYQPLSAGSDEFCEDIPNVAESVFVIDYLHDFLKEMSVDFRIIRDSGDLGTYAKWEDIVRLTDIESDTVYYQPPVVRSDGVFTSAFDFKEKGGYIGIVTATHPSRDNLYNAVFYFQVGGADWGYLPLFVLFLVFAQGLYWFMNKHLAQKKLNHE
jgi:hypothetical protein